MNLYGYIKQIFKAKTANGSSDFSTFALAVPLTRKQLLIEECKKQDVSIYIDDQSEQSAGIYANLRAVASQAELERRLNTRKAIALSERANTLSKRANIIALLALIVSAIPLVKPFL